MTFIALEFINMNINTLIIGAGPAGIAAAIQLKRAGIPFVLLEKKKVGGLLLNANLVENFPGLVKPMSGIELVGIFQKQLKDLKISITKEKVLKISRNNNEFLAQTNKDEYHPQNIIVATGTRPKKVETYLDTQIEYDVYNIRNMQNNKICIIGSGDAAFDYALSLREKNLITIMSRGSKWKCLPILFNQATSHNDIFLKINTEPDNNNTKEFDIVLIAIGREPELSFLSPKLMNLSLEKKLVPCLYFAGDVRGDNARQTTIAIGEGMKAAMDIIKGIVD